MASEAVALAAGAQHTSVVAERGCRHPSVPEDEGSFTGKLNTNQELLKSRRREHGCAIGTYS